MVISKELKVMIFDASSLTKAIYEIKASILKNSNENVNANNQ
jgi:ABC-type molybdate transport system substrate-binding protein